jgi:hypothetical protein
LLCRIGRAVPPERAGLIAGVVGAVAGLGGLLPPALLHAARAAQGQYTVGIMVLSAVSLACATYVRRRHDWINPLAFPLLHSTPRALAPSEFQANATTVVALAASDTVADQAVVLAILSELATRQELIIVYGLDAQPSDSLTPTQLVAAIRDRLPRHEIAAVLVDAAGRTDSCDWALLADLVADGAIAVAVAEGPDLAAATQVAVRRLNADTVWALSRNPAGEVGLHPPATASVDALAAQPRTPSR